MQRRKLWTSLGVAVAAAAAAPEASYLRRLKAVTRSLRETQVLAAGRLMYFDDQGATAVLGTPSGQHSVPVSEVIGAVVPGDDVWVDTAGALRTLPP